MKILIVAKQNSELVKNVSKKIKQVEVQSTFNGSDAKVLVWIPTTKTVDEDVFDLVSAVDQAKITPLKIIMLAIAGINDEVTPDILERRFGSQFSDTVLAYQYAVKMIDELEIPYTIIRAVSTVHEKTAAVITNEGEPVKGSQIEVARLADLIVKATLTDQYLNQSIGIADN